MPCGSAPAHHPRVHVEPDALHIRDGRYVTSAGISAGIDPALALVEGDHGAEAAPEAARELVVFRSDLLGSLTASVLADPAADHSLPAMAASAAVSTRHLTRLFQTELNTTPARWVERVRLKADVLAHFSPTFVRGDFVEVIKDSDWPEQPPGLPTQVSISMTILSSRPDDPGPQAYGGGAEPIEAVGQHLGGGSDASDQSHR